MGQLIEEMMKSGALLATEGCLPSRLGVRVRLAGGDISVTDGPFTESKELVGGFAILQADSKNTQSSWCGNSCRLPAMASARFDSSTRPQP
jgi:hypothetical protein